MKIIKFKKWIIFSCVTLVLTILFLIFAVISSGSAFVSLLENTFIPSVAFNLDSDEMRTGLARVLNNDYYFDSDASNDNDHCFTNRDDFEVDFSYNHDIDADISNLLSSLEFTTKDQLNTGLDTIIEYINDNDYSSDKHKLESIIDYASDYITDAIEQTPVSGSNQHNEDNDEYFERTQLEGTDLDNYITQYIQNEL